MERFILNASDGHKVACYRWIPAEAKGVIQIAHGMGEHAARYDAVAQKLNEAGYVVFESANNQFDGPDATGYEWLTRDAAEVKKYVEDDKCGFVLSIGSLVDMYAGGAVSQNPLAIEKIPETLPMYIFSGSDDPIHGEQADLDRMVNAYRDRGIKKLDYHLYPDGRHEMFNETNRSDVVNGLIAWLDSTLGE